MSKKIANHVITGQEVIGHMMSLFSNSSK